MLLFYVKDENIIFLFLFYLYFIYVSLKQTPKNLKLTDLCPFKFFIIDQEN
jgi:hypothetical protein